MPMRSGGNADCNYPVHSKRQQIQRIRVFDMKPLKRIARELTADPLWGDWSGLRGYCSGLWGDCTGLQGNCTKIWGDCTGLYGDCTNLVGDCTDLEGNLDDIPMDQRKEHPNLTDWVEGDILGNKG